MSNSLLNISTITKESVMILKNELGFAKGVNRQYDDKFAVSGAKVGSVVNIRKPVRFSVTSGASLNLQDVADQSVALTLDTQNHVGFQFTSKELTLNIDEFSKRYLQPAVAALANKIDLAGCALYTSVWNSVGTPGTAASSSTAVGYALGAMQKLNENGCPMDGRRSIVLSPASESSYVGALSGLFQSAEKIADQYEKGRMGLAFGAKWKMDQNIYTHTVGPLGGTPTVKTTIAAEGATTVVSQAWTSAAASRLKAGDVFTIASVYSVNPQSRLSTGSLQQFVVASDFSSDSSGEGTITFTPAIYTTGAYQNVNRYPTASDAILIFGAANTYHDAISPANLAYHEDAFVLGMADLAMPDGVDMASRAQDADAGLSLRIVRAYDINNDRFPCRIDVLYGWKPIYPELACRIQN